MKALLLVAVAAVLVARSVPALAGIADSPIPLLQGQRALLVYSVPGVVTAGGIGTYFSCTSTEKVDIRVSVELFDDAGNGSCSDASAVSRVVAPGASVMFATQNASDAFPSAQLLTPAPVLITGGSARILSTSKALLCSAFLADAYNAPPTSMTKLNVLAKTKQKGD